MRALEGQDFYVEVRPGIFKSIERGLKLRENDPDSAKSAVQWVKVEARAHIEGLTKAVKSGTY